MAPCEGEKDDPFHQDNAPFQKSEVVTTPLSTSGPQATKGQTENFSGGVVKSPSNKKYVQLTDFNYPFFLLTVICDFFS